MKIAAVATAVLFLGLAAPAVSAAPATGTLQAQGAQERMQDVGASHRRWHRYRYYHRHHWRARHWRSHRVCRTHWRHGRRITVCRTW